MVNLIRRNIEKKKFLRLCEAHGLTLDYTFNQRYFSVWDEVFIQRCYADYFPFHQSCTIVDVGAHVGSFALFAATYVAPHSRIFALEPSSENFQVLQQNLSKHTFPIVTEKCALSSSDGEQALHLHASINHTLVDQYTLSTEHARSERVQTMTLASWMAKHEITHIDFLKLDCEGSEYAILESTPADVLKRIRTISLEFHDMKSAEHCGLSLVKLFESIGFRVVKFMHEPSQMGLNYGKIIATQDGHH